ncbi:CPBP family intramembrane glutamic endopeptidase [Candidatus Lokiarchaeum ossiferum]|uniref:CPBP family intramembrane glutamic endopeptidase n=1 Tax=Candidatus Lokiarchaeum ossiferum TaxID=2951803 RepID=UPI00352C0EBF
MEKTDDLLFKDQHNVLKSVILHLFPGLLVLGGIFLFSQPIFCEILGLDARFGPLLGWLMSITFCLIPVQLGILLYVGKRQNDSFNIKEVLGNKKNSPTKIYLIFIPIYIIFAFVFMFLLAPPVNNFFVEKIFSWYPQEYNFQNQMQDPASMQNYKGFQLIFILYILLSCIAAPFVEELYFRGYLLPRMDEKMGKGAPYINAILFSIYHFFSPWENLIRIVILIPLVYFVWIKKNMRLSILTHIILNCMGAVAMAIMVYFV